MADCVKHEEHEKASVMADFVKVAVARNVQNQDQGVTKIWCFRRSYVTDYTLAEAEEILLNIFQV